MEDKRKIRVASDLNERNKRNEKSLSSILEEDSAKMDISPVSPPPVVAVVPAPKRKRKAKATAKVNKGIKAKARRKTVKKLPKVAAKVVAKVAAKQKEKRADVIAKKRDPCKALQTYGYSVSHGEMKRSVVQIPSNVRLIQFATPTMATYGPDVYGILQQLAEVRPNGVIRLRKNVKQLNPPPILVSKLTGKIFVPDGNDLLVTEPGEETTDMKLSFDLEYQHIHPLFGMHIAYPDGKIVSPPEHTTMTLGSLLAEVSSEYAKKCPDRVLNFVQVSCKLNASELKVTVVDDQPVAVYERAKKPTIMDVGNLAQFMKRGLHITSSLEKEAERDRKQGATPEPTEVVYGRTNEITDRSVYNPTTSDDLFYRVDRMSRAKELYRDIRGKRPLPSSDTAAAYVAPQPFVFT